MIYKATADEIVKYARTWKGTPWRHQGRCESGIDCAGLLIMTARHFDIPHKDMLGYRRDPGKIFQRNVEDNTLPSDEIVHGSIGIFTDNNQPCHTGIFSVEDGHITLIHSEVLPKRRVHEQPFDGGQPPLRRRLISVRLFKEVDYVVVSR